MDGHQAQALTPEAQQKWAEISPQIEIIWEKVVEVANNVLQAHLKFGFPKFEKGINPSIEEILLSLKVVKSTLDAMSDDGALDYSESRKVGNALQQIWNVQSVGTALKSGDEANYNDAIAKLKNQATF